MSRRTDRMWRAAAKATALPIMEKASVVEACKRELATNFNCSAAQIVGVYAAKLGLSTKQMEREIERTVKA